MTDNELPQTPEPRQGFRVGDTVHVYMGTSAGVRAHRTVAYIGTVVGFHEEERKWLVRNNILAKKGQPNRVDEAFMSRYTHPTAYFLKPCVLRQPAPTIRCNSFGISPFESERRLNMRTISEQTKQRCTLTLAQALTLVQTLTLHQHQHLM